MAKMTAALRKNIGAHADRQNRYRQAGARSHETAARQPVTMTTMTAPLSIPPPTVATSYSCQFRPPKTAAYGGHSLPPRIVAAATAARWARALVTLNVVATRTSA